MSTLQQRQVVALVLAVLAGAGCGRDSGWARSDTAAAVAASGGADSTVTVRGTVASVSPTDVVLTTPTGSVTVKIGSPFEVYDREPGTVADVKNNSFVGVTSVKQPDGSERATEIHIFPEELRGLGEGSRMMTQNPSGAGSRMTNGAVSGSRMTNGTASPSRMSNGSVASANGSALVVQYTGGSQKITIPPNTTVTAMKATTKPLAAGDNVVILAKKAADGSFSANRALIAGK